MSDDTLPSTATVQPTFDQSRLDAALESFGAEALPTSPPTPASAQDSPTEPATAEAAPEPTPADTDAPVESLAARFKRLAQREKEQAEHRRSMKAERERIEHATRIEAALARAKEDPSALAELGIDPSDLLERLTAKSLDGELVRKAETPAELAELRQQVQELRTHLQQQEAQKAYTTYVSRIEKAMEAVAEDMPFLAAYTPDEVLEHMHGAYKETGVEPSVEDVLQALNEYSEGVYNKLHARVAARQPAAVKGAPTKSGKPSSLPKGAQHVAPPQSTDDWADVLDVGERTERLIAEMKAGKKPA